ncbi:MAG: sel1 repeat family protein [Holosporales bacterium]|nr:sel1 repeat family protein [Holosporales bacterium]
MQVVSKIGYTIVTALVTGCVQANRDPIPQTENRQSLGNVASPKEAALIKKDESPQKILKNALETQSNDPETLVGVAEDYYNGNGVPRDIGMSLKYFLKAAELGSGYACRRMGMEFSDFAFDDPTPRDDPKARAWFEKGAELGDSEATYYLSEFLFEGRGGPKDEKRATAMLIKAGNMKSQRAAHRALKLEHKGAIVLDQKDKREFFALDRQLKQNQIARG